MRAAETTHACSLTLQSEAPRCHSWLARGGSTCRWSLDDSHRPPIPRHDTIAWLLLLLLLLLPRSSTASTPIPPVALSTPLTRSTLPTSTSVPALNGRATRRSRSLVLLTGMSVVSFQCASSCAAVYAVSYEHNKIKKNRGELLVYG